MYGSATAPTGWLLCDGTAVSRTLYSNLFNVIAVGFGPGDGTNTFNIPDLRGRVPVGFAAAGGHTDVAVLGNNDGVAAANRRPKHRTTDNITVTSSLGISDPGHSHNLNEQSGGNNAPPYHIIAGSGSTTVPTPTAGDIVANTTGISLSGSQASRSGSIGTNNANDALDTPAYLVVNYIIKT
jgi:microcystin-dependent protein